MIIDCIADAPLAPPRPLAPSHRIAVYSRAKGRRVRFVSDATPVADAELVEVVHFDSRETADAVAQECGDTLTMIRFMGPDAEGWHTLPKDCELERFLANLLRTAKRAVWSRLAPGIGLSLEDAMLPSSGLPGTLPSMREADPSPASSAPIPPLVVPAALAATATAEPLAPLTRPRPRPRRAAMVWTRDLDFALYDLVHCGLTAKEIAADPRFAAVARGREDKAAAIHRHACDIGLSFRDPPDIVISGLGSTALDVFDRAARVAHKTRGGFVRAFLQAAAANPGRYGLAVMEQRLLT